MALKKKGVFKWKHFVAYIVIAAIGLFFTVCTLIGGGLAPSASMIYLLEKISISIILALAERWKSLTT